MLKTGKTKILTSLELLVASGIRWPEVKLQIQKEKSKNKFLWMVVHISQLYHRRKICWAFSGGNTGNTG